MRVRIPARLPLILAPPARLRGSNRGAVLNALECCLTPHVIAVRSLQRRRSHREYRSTGQRPVRLLSCSCNLFGMTSNVGDIWIGQRRCAVGTLTVYDNTAGLSMGVPSVPFSLILVCLTERGCWLTVTRRAGTIEPLTYENRLRTEVISHRHSEPGTV